MSGSSGISATEKLPEADGPFACSRGQQGTAVPEGAAAKGKMRSLTAAVAAAAAAAPWSGSVDRASAAPTNATSDASGSLAGVPPGETASGEEDAAAVDADSVNACGNSRRNHILTFDQLPQRVKDCQYAVRGPTVTLAGQLARRLSEKQQDIPFDKLIYVNVGDPQALGQPPITFFRQILACLVYPPVMGLPLNSNSTDTTAFKEALDSSLKDESLSGASAKSSLALDFCPSDHKVPFPTDVVSRATEYLKAVRSVGAYSHSQGVPLLREKIASWFTERDGFRADPDDLFLTNGASSAVTLLIEVLYRGPEDGLLFPIPQYPLYAGLLTRIGGRCAGYHLDEEAGWSLDVAEITRALNAARAESTRVRGIVVINPGNPTGQVIAEDKLREVALLCHREGLLLLADEVYQENIYEGSQFVPLRKLVLSMNLDISLVSLHSSSKGLVGECGFRGGCMLIENVDIRVKQTLYKLSSMSLCSNVSGQLMLCNVCNPPRKGEPSYERYVLEKQLIHARNSRKAEVVYKELNTVPGICCQKIQGGVFGFPRIELPKRAVEAAAAEGVAPDLFFSLELLKATGVVGVAGSGFGQREGTHHVRICILPDEALLDEMVGKLKKFYIHFVNKYKD